MKQKRPRYTEEEKKKALALADEKGLKAAATTLGINMGSIATWRKKAKPEHTVKKARPPEGAALESFLTSELMKKTCKLEKQNAILTRIIEIFLVADAH